MTNTLEEQKKIHLDPDEVAWRQLSLKSVRSRAKGFLHLGAHKGQEAAEYAKFVKSVVWIEALPFVYTELEKHLSSFAGQHAMCALLDEVDGRQRTMGVSNNMGGVSSSVFSFGPFAQGPDSLWPELNLHMVDSITLSGITLDSLIKSNEIQADSLDHWIVDLQGAELLALRGGINSLRHCKSILVEVSQVPVYSGGVLWPELCNWLKNNGFVPVWDPVLQHDDVLFIRSDQLEHSRKLFHSDHYLRHNARRLEHLASLNIPLYGLRVLEVGAGIGDHTSFYVDRGCSVVSTEARAENLTILKKRWSGNRAVKVRALDMDNPLHLNEEPFDLIHCYGLLYHLRNPEEAIRFMSMNGHALVLETCIALGDSIDINHVNEAMDSPTQAFHGTGCRPHEYWVLQTLRKYFNDAYVTQTQPQHPEFDQIKAIEKGGLFRKVFFAKGSRLLSATSCN